jgi:hypothetical protein
MVKEKKPSFLFLMETKCRKKEDGGTKSEEGV